MLREFCKFCHVHNSKMFVDWLHSVKMYELHSVRPKTIGQVISTNKNVYRNSIEYKPFNRNIWQEFKIFSANLYSDNRTEQINPFEVGGWPVGVYTVYYTLNNRTVAGQKLKNSTNQNASTCDAFVCLGQQYVKELGSFALFCYFQPFPKSYPSTTWWIEFFSWTSPWRCTWIIHYNLFITQFVITRFWI